jgi:predicted O-methyltransferase YrrM
VVTWTGDNSFEIGDVEYVCSPMLRGGFPSQPGRFCLVKPRSEVEAYEQLLHDLAPRVIVEVGTFDGASTAFFADVARPTKLVGIDRRPTRSVALDDFVARRHLGGVLLAHYGVDQGDAPKLRGIVGADLDGQCIDLVIDDASHLLDLTRRTFNTLFPLVRPGGTYVIEDWWWAHATASESILPDEVPMTVLVFELVMACASAPGVISNVVANRNWVVVERGPAALDSTSFDLSTCYGPRGRALLTNP